jgi:hypothetical protein
MMTEAGRAPGRPKPVRIPRAAMRPPRGRGGRPTYPSGGGLA